MSEPYRTVRFANYSVPQNAGTSATGYVMAQQAEFMADGFAAATGEANQASSAT